MDRFQEILVGLSIPVLMLMEKDLAEIQKEGLGSFESEIEQIQTILAEKIDE
jgi:hypothetical protein